MKLKNVLSVKGQEYLVSTVKLDTFVRNVDCFIGIDDDNYETMIFKKDDLDWNYGEPIYTKHYHTEEEAVRGHDFCVKNIEELVKRSA